MLPDDLTVFVYGTLKPGGHYWPRFCEGKVADPVPAKVRGELYDLHIGYPGLRLIGDSWVQGYCLTFRNEADFLQLDQLEGYAPDRPVEQNEYLRLKLPCADLSGAWLGEVWAYEITKWMLQKHNATRIPDGNWPV
ncbi:MAG: gamma-glutamylcyclotransferase [Opitutales bacterium]